MLIRAAAAADLAAIQAIYAHHVITGLGTFEIEPPDLAEITRRHAEITAAGFPYLVAEDRSAVLGYAYASHFRTRVAYRYTVENSIYVAPTVVRRGVGKALLDALIERCAVLGWRQMLAVIGDSANTASIGMHRACGFESVGVMRSVGHKAGRWLDVVIMQRTLGNGAATPPGQ